MKPFVPALLALLAATPAQATDTWYDPHPGVRYLHRAGGTPDLRSPEKGCGGCASATPRSGWMPLLLLACLPWIRACSRRSR